MTAHFRSSNTVGHTKRRFKKSTLLRQLFRRCTGLYRFRRTAVRCSVGRSSLPQTSRDWSISRSAGKKYRDAVRWKQSVFVSKELADLMVQECKSENFRGCDLIFPSLDSDVAGDIGRS